MPTVAVSEIERWLDREATRRSPDDAFAAGPVVAVGGAVAATAGAAAHAARKSKRKRAEAEPMVDR